MPSVLSLTTALTEAQQTNLAYSQPLRPLIVGPKAFLIRHSEASEKASGLLGDYDHDDDVVYSIPGFREDGLFDASYDKLSVTFENAHLLYATKLIDDAYGTLTPDSDYQNRVVADTMNFKAYTNPSDTEYAVSDLFEERGVKVGDVVYLWATVSSELKELWTTVSDFVNDETSASIASAVAGGTNAATQVASATSAVVSGSPANQVELLSADIDETDYDGSADGDISDTYTVTVTTGGPAASAKLRIRSASGNDDYDDVTPAAFASPTTLSEDRVLLGTFTLDAANAVDSGIAADEFVAGQAWTVTVNGGYTAVTGTSAGTYTGTELDETPKYKVTVTRGGKYQTVQDVADPTVNPTPTGPTTGGTVAAATYHVKVTFTGDTAGETTNEATPTSVTTTGATSTIVVPSPAQPTGAAQWKLYISNTGAAGAYKLQDVATNFGTGITVTAYDSGGTAMPSSSTATYTAANPTPPQITVTRDDGADSSGPTDVVASATAYAVGTKGVTISFNQTKLVKDDYWEITVTTGATGAYQTLVLANDLDTVGLDAASDLNAKFFIKESSIAVPENSEVSPYGDNWTLDATSPDITMQSGIYLFDSAASWTVDGVRTALPVYAGREPCKMYLTYRQWIQDDSNEIKSISDLTDVEADLGTVSPDNPLAQAVSWALQNTPSANSISMGVSGSVVDEIKYAALNGDPTDPDVWASAIELFTGNDSETAYNIVPLTTDEDILALFTANATTESASTNGRYRSVWVPATVAATEELVSEAENGGLVLAKLLDNPAVSGTQYTYLVVPAGNGNFITNGVTAGDEVRYQFGTDVYGDETYNTYTVAEVISEDALYLRTGPDAGESTAIKVEVHHPRSKADQVADLKAKAAAHDNRRVYYVWPDVTVVDGENHPSYFLAAAFAGLAGAIPANQSLTKIAVAGPTSDVRANYFSNGQLQELEDGGVFVIQQQKASEGGAFYARHSVTTAQDGDINNVEEQAVRLLDAIGYAYLTQWATRYGSSNLTNDLITQLNTDFIGVTDSLKAVENTNVRVGTLLSDARLVSLVRHPTIKSRALATIEVVIAYPFHKAQLTLTV